MRIVFWQNCLSPHQLPYIARLMDDERVESVAVVAGEAVSGARRQMGWELAAHEGLDRCAVYVAPHDVLIDRLLEERPQDTWHLFSGIRGFAFVFKVLARSMGRNLHRGLITERPFTYARGLADGKPLWMHQLRFALQDRPFARGIQAVFAMGDEAVDYFRRVWKDWQVFPFAYCTERAQVPSAAPAEGACRFAFVGQLSPRKAPMDVLRAYRILTKSNGGGSLTS